MTDIHVYRRGIARLLQCLDRHDPLYDEVLRCRQDLGAHPGTDILQELDRLARCRIGVSFEALCTAAEPAADVDALLDEGCCDQVARLWKQACR